MQNCQNCQHYRKYYRNDSRYDLAVPQREIYKLTLRVGTDCVKLTIGNGGNNRCNHRVDIVNPRLTAVFQLVHAGVHGDVFGIGAFHVIPVFEISREEACHGYAFHAEGGVIATLHRFVVAVAPNVGIVHAHGIGFVLQSGFSRCLLQNKLLQIGGFVFALKVQFVAVGNGIDVEHHADGT